MFRVDVQQERSTPLGREADHQDAAARGDPELGRLQVSFTELLKVYIYFLTFPTVHMFSHFPTVSCWFSISY